MYALSNARRIIGSIIVCASQDIGMLIVGRIINGLAVGVST
jgi:predicted MFS family arabinose efflux permease